MPRPTKFEFERTRGIVWVCDVAGSSSRLNSDDGVSDTEEFLPRLYWIAALIVEAAGGKFIKWTGDGFLAWFETPLHRDLSRTVRRCLQAAWHLTLIVNVTQLGLKPKRQFKIRHGITYEQDALLIRATHDGGFETSDLLGRSVVLAFRLSGIAGDFPFITTHREIATAANDSSGVRFRRWNPSAGESLKYFKGEKWGTKSLYISVAKRSRSSSLMSALKQARAAMQKVEGKSPIDDAELAFSKSLNQGLISGPDWGRSVAKSYLDFIRDGLYRNLKQFIAAMQKSPKGM